MVDDSKHFCRPISIEASYETIIDIQIDGVDGHRRDISGCPYKFSDLFHDQGLDCHFGWSSYGQALAAARVMYETTPELEKLVNLLQKY